jgi:hypothetical protein
MRHHPETPNLLHLLEEVANHGYSKVLTGLPAGKLAARELALAVTIPLSSGNNCFLTNA